MNGDQTKLGTVVVVDDESMITNPITRLLEDLFEEEELHYKVLASQSPAEILSLVENYDSDLAVVISDIMMEPIGGLEFLKLMKARHPETLLIVLTGFASEYDAYTLKEKFELFSYLEKPWDDDQLKRTVKNALDSYRRKRLLNRYVPKEIVEEVLRRPDNEILAGVEQEVTVMFLDIRNSTQLFHSETLGVQAALQRLNTYFRELLVVLDKYDNGILDKFMGDGIMALFGLPVSYSRTPSQDARDAVLAALEMRERVQRLNRQARPPLTIGIGISTGWVIAGNVGTEERANYTVLGNDVNIASRLEKAARPIKDGILISQNTYDYVKEIVKVEPYDPLPAKGKRGRVPVYQVLERLS